MEKRVTITTIICDICKKEDDKCKRITYPVIFHTDQTEGRSSEPYISYEKLDICEDCAKKVIKLHGYGAQGANTYTTVDKEEYVSKLYKGDK